MTGIFYLFTIKNVYSVQLVFEPKKSRLVIWRISYAKY